MTTSALPRPDVREPLSKFTVDPCIGGYAVVAIDTGRPLAEKDERHIAERIAKHLNQAAAYGPKSLARALGAVDDDEADDIFL